MPHEITRRSSFWTFEESFDVPECAVFNMMGFTLKYSLELIDEARELNCSFF
jgi:hypothetical protein